MLTKSQLAELDLNSLADRLAQVRATRTAQGWGTDNAVTKTTLERRILEVVCRGQQSDRSAISVEHQIELEVMHKKIEAEVAEIRSGGLVIPSDSAVPVGTHGIVKIRTENDYPLKVKCVVRELKDAKGIGIAFENLEGASERRVQRLILELLKNQEVG